MLKIRLQRVGRKHEPTFRLVLTDSKNSTKSGKFHEVLGSYDPRKTNEHFDSEKIKSWISKGAQPSDTVKNLLIQHKIIEGKKVNVLPRKSPIKKEEESNPQPTTDNPQGEVGDQQPTTNDTQETPVAEESKEKAPEENIPEGESAPEAEPAPEATPEEKPAE